MPSRSAASEHHMARVCLGEIVAPHGVRGEVKIKTFTGDPANLVAYGPASDDTGARRLEITVTGRTRGGVIASINGIEDRDAAAALKGIRLYVARAALPEPDEDEFYHGDLIGLAAERDDGTLLGRVVAVHDFGAGDVLEVGVSDERTVMVPFTKEVVPEIDVDGGRLVVTAPPGLFEEEEP